MAAFFNRFIDSGNADVFVQPAAQTGRRAESRHLAAVDQNHQTLAFALSRSFRRFKRSIDFRFQLIRFGLFAEDLRQRVDTLFGTFFEVGGIGGHLDGRRNGVQLVKRFGCTAADDDELRFVSV